jgi:Flp pilus assembly protein TadG
MVKYALPQSNRKTRRRYGARAHQRTSRASALVEAIVGIVVIIPIGLASVDVVTLISTSQSNEQVAEQAARAAACQRTAQDAQKAAEETCAKAPTSAIITAVQVESVNFDAGKGQVTVTTDMNIHVPIPMPWMNIFNLRAAAMQPIVSFPAAL